MDDTLGLQGDEDSAVEGEEPGGSYSAEEDVGVEQIGDRKLDLLVGVDR